jgi:hypothetical protein
MPEDGGLKTDDGGLKTDDGEKRTENGRQNCLNLEWGLRPGGKPESKYVNFLNFAE